MTWLQFLFTHKFDLLVVVVIFGFLWEWTVLESIDRWKRKRGN